MDRLPRAETARNCRAQPDGLSMGCDWPALGRTSTFGFSRRKRRCGLQASQDRFCRAANIPLVLVGVLMREYVCPIVANLRESRMTLRVLLALLQQQVHGASPRLRVIRRHLEISRGH